MTNILKNTILFKWIIILFRKSIELISRAIHFFIRLIVYFTKYERFFFTMGQCLFRHRTKTRFFFFFFFFFFALNILSNPRRWREEKKRQISHSRGLYSSLLSRGSSRQRESLAFFFQRDEPRWRRRRDKSTRLDRENGIEERRVFARVLILARVTLVAIRSRLKRDRAALCNRAWRH